MIGLAYLVTEGDHRNGSGETSLKGMHHTLHHLTAQLIEPLDCRDDRLSHRLTHVRQPVSWHQIEHDLHAGSLEVDDVPQALIRGDASTVSGEPEGTAGGLIPFGQSQDDPTRPPSNVMMGSLAPWGMPLSTAVWSGERADEG